MDYLRLRRSPITAASLAEHMDVSLRTIYRDIADLQKLGAPIRGEGGIGYVMEKGFFVPSLNFDTDELEAIALGVQLVEQKASGGLSKAAQSAAAKITSAIGDTKREQFLSTPLASGPANTTAADLHDNLRGTIRARCFVEIEYESLGGKRSTRRARPLGLTVFDRVWLLTIWCETAQDFRHLRVDRIRKVTAEKTHFRHERGKRFEDALRKEEAG